MIIFIFRHRVILSAAASAFVILLLLYYRTTAFQPPLSNSAPIELTLSTPIDPLPTTKPLVPQLAATPVIERKLALDASPQKAPAAKITPVEPAANVTTAPPGLVPAQLTHASPVQSISVPSAATIDSGRNAEASYAGKVRAYLQTVKRYPTGREASLQRPAGTSAIWFIVRRSGEMVEAGIETSSGSMLLDNAALTTIRRGAYPVFPDEAWPGKAQQRFTVELNFVPVN
jgi:protein TonB